MSSMIKDPIRIVIFDNYALIRAGIRRLIEDQQGMEVVGETGDLDKGLDIVANLKPDIVLLELNLIVQPDQDIIPKIINAFERVRLILITDEEESQVNQQAVEDGVMGLVFKTEKPATLVKAIEKVNTGEVWLGRLMIAHVLSRLSRNQQLPKKDPEKVSITLLSKREKDVMGLIGQGYRNKEISAQLNISEATVRHHLTSIYGKMGVSDRLELLVYAHNFGLLKK